MSDHNNATTLPLIQLTARVDDVEESFTNKLNNKADAGDVDDLLNKQIKFENDLKEQKNEIEIIQENACLEKVEEDEVTVETVEEATEESEIAEEDDDKESTSVVDKIEVKLSDFKYDSYEMRVEQVDQGFTGWSCKYVHVIHYSVETVYANLY